MMEIEQLLKEFMQTIDPAFDKEELRSRPSLNNLPWCVVYTHDCVLIGENRVITKINDNCKKHSLLYATNTQIKMEAMPCLL